MSAFGSCQAATCDSLAEGRITIEKQRADKAERKRKSHGKSALRNADLGQSAFDYDWHKPPKEDLAS
jgi:hypothetical protein